MSNQSAWRMMPQRPRVVNFGKVDEDTSSEESLPGQSAAAVGSINVCHITPSLIAKITGLPRDDAGFDKILILDLHLRDSKLGKISTISNLHLVPNLKQLNLSYNAISKISGLENLNQLIELNLAENSIREIENFEHLSQLERLNLSGNHIQRIPESISMLQKLKIFRITRNELHTIRDLKNLADLSNLTRLTFDENPISELPHARSFATFHIASLEMIDGRDISQEDREDANMRYGPDELSHLRNQLSMVNQKSDGLQREVSQTKRAKDTTAIQLVTLRQRLNMETAARTTAQLDLEDATKKLHHQSVEVEAVKGLAYHLHDQLQDVIAARSNPSSPQRVPHRSSLQNIPSQRVRRNEPMSSNELSGYESPTSEEYPRRGIPIGVDTNQHRQLSSPHSRSILQQQQDLLKADYQFNQMPAFTPDSKPLLTPSRNKDVTSHSLRQVTAMQERMDKLSGRLMSSETEKQKMQQELSRLHEQIRVLEQLEANPGDLDSPIDNPDHDQSHRAIHEVTIKLHSRIKSLLSDVEILNKTKIHLNEKLNEVNTSFNLLKTDHEMEVARNKELTRLNERHCQTIQELESKYMILSQERYSSASLLDARRQDETRIDVIHLRSEVEAVKESRNEAIRDITVLNEKNRQLQQDADMWHNKFLEQEHENKRILLHVHDQEVLTKNLNRAMVDKDENCNALKDQCNDLEKRNAILLQTKHALEADVEALLHRSNMIEKTDISSREKGAVAAVQKGADNADMRSRSRPRGLVSTLTSAGYNPSSKQPYLQGASTDSDDLELPVGSGVQNNDSKVSHIGDVYRRTNRKMFTRQRGLPMKKPFQESPQSLSAAQSLSFTPSKLEVAAAATMAQLLVDEINPSILNDSNLPNETASSTGGGPGAGESMNRNLKEACLRAAMRLIRTAVTHQENISPPVKRSEENFGDDEEKSFSPVRKHRPEKTQPSIYSLRDSTSSAHGVDPFILWDTLGSKDVLANIVTQAKMDMDAIQQTKLLRIQQKQLEVVVKDLEGKAERLSLEIATRERKTDELQKQCTETKRQAVITLDELEALTRRLEVSRQDIASTDSQMQISRRELEHTRQQLTDAISMNEIEQRNMSVTKERLNELKAETNAMEEALLHTKERLIEEESKIRIHKSVVNDQLRILQNDLAKIQTDFKAKQRSIEELEKYKRAVEEECEIRRRDMESQLLASARDLENENKKLSASKSLIRTERLEAEQLSNKRRQLESEVARFNELLHVERSKFEAEEISMKRKLEDQDRLLSEIEKRARVAKEHLAQTESEQLVIRHAVDELRRQRDDLERAAETRRRNSEDAANQSQQQAQLAARTMHQLNAQTEQRRIEYEAITCEFRTMERRYEELKRASRDQELLQDSRREELKNLVHEQERVKKDLAAAAKEDDNLRHQVSCMKASHDTDTRAAEDARRRISALLEEESSLKESEAKLKLTSQTLRKNLEDAQVELDEVRNYFDRDRRSLADLRTKKSLDEIEVHRLQELLRFNQEQLSENAKRKADSDATITRINDEISRSQKDLILAQRRVTDEERKEEAVKLRALESRVVLNGLQQELEKIQSLAVEEQKKVESLRIEHRELSVQCKKVNEAIKLAEKELSALQNSHEVVRSQIEQSEQIRSHASSELDKLREMELLEMKRSERLDQAYTDAELRLKELRHELAKTVDNLEKTKSLTSEEEQRVQEQRRILRVTLDELSSTEHAIAASNRKLYEERQRAIVEISQLDLAKQSAQSHMFLIAEAGKRLTSSPQQSTDGRHHSNDPFLRSASEFTSPANAQTVDQTISTAHFSKRNHLIRKAAADLERDVTSIPRHLPAPSSGVLHSDSISTSGIRPSEETKNGYINASISNYQSLFQSPGATSVISTGTGSVIPAAPQHWKSSDFTGDVYDSSGAEQQEVDFSSLQKELEKLKVQSAAVLQKY